MRARRRELGFSIRDVVRRTGIAPGDISLIERGYLIPTHEQAVALMRVYGDPDDWYPATVWRAFDADLSRRVCPGCDEPLEPDASKGRRYHDDRCRARARRATPG